MVEVSLSLTSGRIVIPFLFPAVLTATGAGPEETKNLAGDALRLIQIRSATASFAKIAPASQDNFSASANRRIEVEKRSQLRICAHAKRFPSPRCASTIQIVRPLRSTADTSAPAPPGFAETVSNDFAVAHTPKGAMLGLDLLQPVAPKNGSERI
jgi:hypothetical protein